LATIGEFRFISALLVLLCLPQSAFRSGASASDLHAQAAAAVLQQRFSDPDLSYLLLDEAGQIVAQRWEAPERELPIGSLIKPFIALAYGRTHRSFPTYRCVGRKTCWLARGHGSLEIRQAIAFSCNSYFHQLYSHAESGFAAPVLGHFGLSVETDGHSGRASPLAVGRAYLELASQPRDKVVAPIVEGMALSASIGTGKAAGMKLAHVPALAKTGTAPCTHSRSAPGDGFAVLLMPADRPRAVLLVRVHGRPGSFAAGVAGKMMAAIENAGASR
jgi:cell division protein FtsI/penicillin-binding protein 2